MNNRNININRFFLLKHIDLKYGSKIAILIPCCSIIFRFCYDIVFGRIHHNFLNRFHFFEDLPELFPLESHYPVFDLKNHIHPGPGLFKKFPESLPCDLYFVGIKIEEFLQVLPGQSNTFLICRLAEDNVIACKQEK